MPDTTVPPVGLDAFHPAVARWFRSALGEPTPVQVRGWAAIRERRHTLIAAPTGSGKTLTAFLGALDDLVRDGLESPLPDEVRVLYVSPLKALSADIHHNLAEPRAGIRRIARQIGLDAPRLTAGVRTGDTPQGERAAMLRQPPHILVTTPESLYLLLTAERSRELLRTVRTVIVDEIHAVIGTRRGAHLALSLERLAHVARAPVTRIGLSATQRPIDLVAGYLVGAAHRLEDGTPDCTVIDEGHVRSLDLGIEVPGSPLEAVMAEEVWEEYYNRLAALIEAHRTTLVFVNTRRLAERVARHLSERLGEAAVTAHHGSMSRDSRLDAERRLKAGELRALVATASLELGIDVGHVELVCQIGSPHAIATLLQRVGRSGHTVIGRPKGRVFPTSRDDLVECAALARAVCHGDLDRLAPGGGPLDVLAQQIVAETAAEEWHEPALFDLVRRAGPYAGLERASFDAVVAMLAEGYATRRGRRGALLHHDAVGARLRGRRHARLTAITSGGAIPDNADYRVVMEPEDLFIGTINEDFAIESMQGDVFQLGNSSWRILRVGQGVVRVADAHGQPPTIPFWLGEAPARTDDLSRCVSDLRADIDARLEARDDVAAWIARECGVSGAAASQIAAYLAEAKRLLGVLPTQKTLVLERFFDESGGMQLVLHAPFGSRVNRAWGLALRKRFCRQFNFELQAAANEDALLLSLGPQHSFPLSDVFRYLRPESVRDVLVQAVLDAPVFQTRWRWNTTVSLAVPRFRGSRKVPPQIQRMEAEDLLSAVFPDATGCLENIGGDREVPEGHPLVSQTIEDCLLDAMDLPRLAAVLDDIGHARIGTLARDLPEPSPLAHEILNARPYAFLDDAPLEERRAQAVQARRASDPSTAADLGALDIDAIERVRGEVWPDVRDPDEVHDVLLSVGMLTPLDAATGGESGSWIPWLTALEDAGRATRVSLHAGDARGQAPARPGASFWVAAERLPDVCAAYDGLARPERELAVPERAAARRLDAEEARASLVRGRLEIAGPVTGGALADLLSLAPSVVDAALLRLEAEGVVLRGRFTPGAADLEWCDRRLLARIHRYTLNRLRAEIEPVSPADFLRFLFAWQRVDPEHQVNGLEGLRAVVEQLDGYELAAGAWEADVLPSRVADYDPAWLDQLCLTGDVGWGRFSRRDGASSGGGPLRSTPIGLFLRAHGADWLAAGRVEAGDEAGRVSAAARETLAALERRGALFFRELTGESGLLASQLETALAELAAAGAVTSDSFAGLRALLTPSDKRKPIVERVGGRRRRTAPAGVEAAGRWSLLAGSPAGGSGEPSRVEAIETQARVLLRRYGVVFRRLVVREPRIAPWRDLVSVFRRLEGRGELRGGRFVAGMSGEQFALPEAVGSLRAVRRAGPGGRLVTVSAADPLNLVGILTPDPRVPAVGANRIVYRDGVPLAAVEGGEVRPIPGREGEVDREIAQALVRRPLPPALRTYLGV